MKTEQRPAGTGGPRRCGDGGAGVYMKVSLKVWEGGKVVVFVSWQKLERNAAFGGHSAQMRGTGVEHASRATCKMSHKDASTEQPKNKRRCSACLTQRISGFDGALNYIL